MNADVKQYISMVRSPEPEGNSDATRVTQTDLGRR